MPIKCIGESCLHDRSNVLAIVCIVTKSAQSENLLLYKSIVIFSPKNNCFTRLAQATGLHYWADMFPSYGEGSEHDKNWTIDIGVVKNRLRDIRHRLAEEQDALEEVYEPFLIQIGFLDRTPRGRVATRLAYEHLGIDMPRRSPSTPTLFS